MVEVAYSWEAPIVSLEGWAVMEGLWFSSLFYNQWSGGNGGYNGHIHCIRHKGTWWKYYCITLGAIGWCYGPLGGSGFPDIGFPLRDFIVEGFSLRTWFLFFPFFRLLLGWWEGLEVFNCSKFWTCWLGEGWIKFTLIFCFPCDGETGWGGPTKGYYGLLWGGPYWLYEVEVPPLLLGLYEVVGGGPWGGICT